MLAVLMLLLLAGGMNGSFAIPLKRVRSWKWENTWLVWSFLTMIVIPLAVAAVTVPNLKAVYSTAGAVPLARIAIYGMLWGASAVLFGLGTTRVGLALGFGIILGTSSSLGAIMPFVLTANAWGLATGEWRGAGGRTAAWAVAGNLLLVAGISVIASAGRAS
jgi:L-rhamnose-H+ transport protein